MAKDLQGNPTRWRAIWDEYPDGHSEFIHYRYECPNPNCGEWEIMSFVSKGDKCECGFIVPDNPPDLPGITWEEGQKIINRQ